MILLVDLQTSVLACFRFSGNIIVPDILFKILAGLPDHCHKILIDLLLLLTTSTIYGLVKFFPKFQLVLLLRYSKTIIKNSIKASLTSIHFVVYHRRHFPSTIFLFVTAIV